MAKIEATEQTLLASLTKLTEMMTLLGKKVDSYGAALGSV